MAELAELVPSAECGPARRENAEDVARGESKARVTQAPNSESGDEWVGRHVFWVGAYGANFCFLHRGVG